MIELLLQAERAMSVGLVDRAETLYAQVADADPQNSIAVVGLARVALERGDEAGALALAQRALSIDPENAAASRMVERLEEVLRYREDAAGPPTAAVAVPSVAAPEPPVAVPPAMPAPPGPVITDVPAEPEPTPRPPATVAPVPPVEPPAIPVAKRRSLLDRLFRRNR